MRLTAICLALLMAGCATNESLEQSYQKLEATPNRSATVYRPLAGEALRMRVSGNTLNLITDRSGQSALTCSTVMQIYFAGSGKFYAQAFCFNGKFNDPLRDFMNGTGTSQGYSGTWSVEGDAIQLSNSVERSDFWDNKFLLKRMSVREGDGALFECARAGAGTGAPCDIVPGNQLKVAAS